MTDDAVAAAPRTNRVVLIALGFALLLLAAVAGRTLLAGGGGEGGDEAGDRTPREITQPPAPTTTSPAAPAGASSRTGRNPFVGRESASGVAPQGGAGDPGPFGPGGRRR